MRKSEKSNLSSSGRHKSRHHFFEKTRSNDFLSPTQSASFFQSPSAISNNNSGIQLKLSIGKSNDRYEQEADTVADNIMRMPDSDVTQRFKSENESGHSIQRKCAECEQEESIQRKVFGNTEDTFKRNTVPTIVDHVLNASGQPLDNATKSFMEPRFNQNFSHIRIHTGSQAAQSANAINAKAYTQSNNIVFGAGQYQPGTAAGNRLMAHELTHTIQQGSSQQGVSKHGASKQGTSKQGALQQKPLQQAGLSSQIQRMEACPATHPGSPPTGWKAYFGNSCVFHCCYRGMLEDRTPTQSDPQNECFYDDAGALVGPGHPHAGCAGSPNHYDSSSDTVGHVFQDPGGIFSWAGLAGFGASLMKSFEPRLIDDNTYYMGQGQYMDRESGRTWMGPGPKF